MIRFFGESGYRQSEGDDCPPMGFGDCAAEEAVQPAANAESILSPLRALRDRVLPQTATGASIATLWRVLSADLARALRADPVGRAEAIALLTEVSKTVGPTAAGRRIVVTQDRFERLRALFDRVAPLLSPVTAAIAGDLLDKGAAFIGMPPVRLIVKLARWRLPRSAERFLKWLARPAVGGVDRSSRRRPVVSSR